MKPAQGARFPVVEDGAMHIHVHVRAWFAELARPCSYRQLRTYQV
jgi:hypothetical protein